jgi:hypothetical protein
MEHGGDARSRDIPRGDACQDCREAHLLDQIVGRNIGAKPEINASPAVTSEIFQHLPVAREGRGAMRDIRTAIGKDPQVLMAVPAHPRMLVDEDCVPKNSAGRKYAEVTSELYWSLAVPTHHLIELVHALRAMHGERNISFLGDGKAVPQQVRGACINLRRAHDTRQPPVG